jgi:serine protease AprX
MHKISLSKFRCQALTAILLWLPSLFPLYAQSAKRDRVWVFFANKSAAVSVSFPEETLARRSVRGDVQNSSWYNLPVDQAYIEGVISTGATLRVVSRWLNAVSVDADQASLASISTLQYVYRISPVSGYKMSLPIPIPRSAPTLLKPSAFNYGPSALQVSMLGIDSLHNSGLSGHNIKIGIMDTGFDTSHVAFARMRSENRILTTRNFLDGGSDVMGVPGGQRRHGTEVLSVVGGFDEGNLIGTAYGASFVLAKTESLTAEIQAEEDHWVAASEWMESLGVDIITSSLGYIDWYDTTQLNGHTAIITQAANIANQLGVVVVNCAGNEGGNIHWRKVIPPADGDSVIAVGAVNADGFVTYFSSQGPTADGRIKPDFCALGELNRLAMSDNGGYGFDNGTSFSAPLLAGGIALLLEEHPLWRISDIFTNLKRASSNASDPNNASGWGIPNFVNAINMEPYGPQRSLLFITPQPARDSVIFNMIFSSAGTAILTVYDLSGAKVQEWNETATEPSTIIKVWDGRNRSNDKIASGIYICVFRVGDTDIRQKLAYFSR